MNSLHFYNPPMASPGSNLVYENTPKVSQGPLQIQSCARRSSQNVCSSIVRICKNRHVSVHCLNSYPLVLVIEFKYPDIYTCSFHRSPNMFIRNNTFPPTMYKVHLIQVSNGIFSYVFLACLQDVQVLILQAILLYVLSSACGCQLEIHGEWYVDSNSNYQPLLCWLLSVGVICSSTSCIQKRLWSSVPPKLVVPQMVVSQNRELQNGWFIDLNG